jgi:hypothetical protein
VFVNYFTFVLGAVAVALALYHAFALAWAARL